MDRFKSLHHKHDIHRDDHGLWMYKDNQGRWQPFTDDLHMAYTVNSPSRHWEVAFFTIVPDMALPAAVL